MSPGERCPTNPRLCIAWLSAGMLSGCCFSSAPPPGVAEPAGPAPAPHELAPPRACPTIEQAIHGIWTRDGFVEEYRAGGVYVLNGREGTIRWLDRGHAFLDVPPTFHEEYALALADEDLLVAADPNGAGTFYTRISPAPGFDPSCWDVRDEIVGTWAGGSFIETYGADGTYRVNELTGSYRITRNGLVHIATSAGSGDYYVALTSPTTAIAMLAQEGARAVEYTRTP